jgi:hypothetical protein
MADHAAKGNGPPKLGKHLVILVHGINTQAQWFGVVKPALEDAGLVAAPAGYGMYGLLRFLLPIEHFRRRAVEKVTRKIKIAMKIYEPEHLSVIAHSFGSFIIARIIASEFQLKWHRIIFCGSVVREDFPLEQYLERFSKPIVNEIGTRDCWPAIAEAVTWGYGSVGSRGFQSPAVEERWHANLRHSDFLKTDFCNKYWVTFLRDGKIERADPPSPLPWYVRILARLPLRWGIVCLLVAALGAPFFVDVTQVAHWFETLIARQERPVAWVPLPSGSRLQNDSPDPIPTFVEANRASAKSITIEPGDVIRDERLERATVKGERWLRFPLRTGFAHVPEDGVQLGLGR